MVFSLLMVLFLFTSRLAESSPPHIVFILIDDLGWNDVSFHGSKQIPTPNIDALAYDGVILNNYYVQQLCTPSRGALMTGKYPIRLGLQHDVIHAEEPWGLSPLEAILPQHLKKLGYTTRGVGKWHLGYFHRDYIPTNRGFDSFFGYWNGKEDFYNHFEEGDAHTHGLDFHDDDKNAFNYFGQYGTDVFTRKAIEIIKNHNTSKPLFLYLAHQAVHAGNSYAPLQAPPDFVERFLHIKDEDRRIFAGMTSALDFSIGELFSALNSSPGMLENSIIVFTTDNGAAVQGIDKSTGSSWPLRGSKYTMWEGGLRGAAFVWSPLLRNAPIKVSSQLMHISDWLPTLYSRAGGNIEDLEKIDGYDQWESICCAEETSRETILHNIDEELKFEAIRKGKYKLLKGTIFDGDFDGWFDKEGKRKDNIPFADNDVKAQSKLYEELAMESKAAKILLDNYGADPLGYFSESVFSNEYCDFEICEECYNQVGNSESSRKHSTDLGSKECCKSSLIVNCGPKPFNASTNCEPKVEYCLFDIESDPCEYNNLAKSLPSVVKELEDMLNQYRTRAVPTRNQPADPAANPKYHGYAWVSWRS